jgi:hypothetical protein
MFHIAVRHLAPGKKVPIVVALARPAHRFREDVDLDRLLSPVLLHHSGGAHEHPGLMSLIFARDNLDKQRVVGSRLA